MAHPISLHQSLPQPPSPLIRTEGSNWCSTLGKIAVVVAGALATVAAFVFLTPVVGVMVGVVALCAAGVIGNCFSRTYPPHAHHTPAPWYHPTIWFPPVFSSGRQPAPPVLIPPSTVGVGRGHIHPPAPGAGHGGGNIHPGQGHLQPPGGHVGVGRGHFPPGGGGHVPRGGGHH